MLWEDEEDDYDYRCLCCGVSLHQERECAELEWPVFGYIYDDDPVRAEGPLRAVEVVVT